ncbi:MAG: CarD family transcriptional regulator [Pseudomonadota bacterium]
MSKSEISFNINDLVVYPAHGVGQICDIETQTIGGTSIDVYVINFERDKMTLRVPVKRVKNCGLRTLATKDEFDNIMTVLSGKAKNRRGMWSRKAQEFESKINSGDLSQIAEVVRDLFKNAGDPDRSYSERVIYENALNRICSEYAAVFNTDIDKATQEISTLLKEQEAA